MAKLPPIYNAEQLTIWPMIDEESAIYGEPLNFTKRLMSYDDSVTSATQTFYADVYPIIIDVDEDKGTLALGISGLTGVEFAKIFGISPEAVTVSGAEFKVINETGDEVPVYCCVALAAQTGKTIYNLRKWQKVRFQKITESVQQKTATRTYSTPTLTGEFIKCERLGIKRSRITGVDVSTTAGQNLKASWFEYADWVGQQSLINTSTFMRGGLAPIDDGDWLLADDVVTVTNSATGGAGTNSYTNTYKAPGASSYSSITSDGVTITTAGTYYFKSVVTDAQSNTSTKEITVRVSGVV